MIYKHREMPLKLRALKSLLRRLEKNHPKYAKIQEDYLRVLAGFKGEQAIDYPLSFLPKEQYAILHDLRLHVKPYYFQLDTLILHASFILILEVKNISGTLLFDTHFHQLIRSQNESEEAFPDPILQAQRQERHLMDWLQKLKLPNIPIYSLVVSSNPRSIIKANEPHSSLLEKVIRSEQLPLKIQSLEQENTPILEKKDMKLLVRSLMKGHTPKELSLLPKYEIKVGSIIKGVICPACSYVPMNRGHGKWCCPECIRTSVTAHRDALEDYSLLIKQTINNGELRDFLIVESHDTAARIAKSMGLPAKGEKKGRVYELSLPEK